MTVEPSVISLVRQRKAVVTVWIVVLKMWKNLSRGKHLRFTFDPRNGHAKTEDFIIGLFSIGYPDSSWELGGTRGWYLWLTVNIFARPRSRHAQYNFNCFCIASDTSPSASRSAGELMKRYSALPVITNYVTDRNERCSQHERRICTFCLFEKYIPKFRGVKLLRRRFHVWSGECISVSRGEKYLSIQV